MVVITLPSKTCRRVHHRHQCSVMRHDATPRCCSASISQFRWFTSSTPQQLAQLTGRHRTCSTQQPVGTPRNNSCNATLNSAWPGHTCECMPHALDSNPKNNSNIFYSNFAHQPVIAAARPWMYSSGLMTAPSGSCSAFPPPPALRSRSTCQQQQQQQQQQAMSAHFTSLSSAILYTISCTYVLRQAGKQGYKLCGLCIACFPSITKQLVRRTMLTSRPATLAASNSCISTRSAATAAQYQQQQQPQK
jgi:hypothetical protein